MESELARCEARLESGAYRKVSASMLLFPPVWMVPVKVTDWIRKPVWRVKARGFDAQPSAKLDRTADAEANRFENGGS